MEQKDGRILHPKVRTLAKKVKGMSLDKLLKEIRSLQEEIGLTPS